MPKLRGFEVRVVTDDGYLTEYGKKVQGKKGKKSVNCHIVSETHKVRYYYDILYYTLHPTCF